MTDDGGEQSGRWWSSLPNFMSAARQVATSSAMAPLQWILAIAAAFCLFGAIFVSPVELKWAFFLLFALALGYVLFAYDSFRRKAPNRLQSETFIHAQSVLRNERLLLLDERNRNNTKVIDQPAVSNTHVQVVGQLAAITGAGTVVVQTDAQRGDK